MRSSTGVACSAGRAGGVYAARHRAPATPAVAVVDAPRPPPLGIVPRESLPRPSPAAAERERDGPVLRLKRRCLTPAPPRHRSALEDLRAGLRVVAREPPSPLGVG